MPVRHEPSAPDAAKPASATRPAIFFDRDGTLIRDHGYVFRPADVVWMPDAPAAIRYANDLGWLVFVVTNQSGVARGFFSTADVEALHHWMTRELARQGAHVDAFYYCPHHPEAGSGPFTGPCDCRKPAPGLILAACRDWPVDPVRSVLVGDADRDQEAAARAGIRACRYEGGSLKRLVAGALEPATGAPPDRAHPRGAPRNR